MLASRDGCTILYSFNHNNSFLIAEQTASPPPPGSKRGNTIRLGRSRGEGANRVASRKVKIGSWKTVEHPSTTSQAFPFCSVVSILTEVLLTRLRLDSGQQAGSGGGGKRWQSPWRDSASAVWSSFLAKQRVQSIPKSDEGTGTRTRLELYSLFFPRDV